MLEDQNTQGGSISPDNVEQSAQTDSQASDQNVNIDSLNQEKNYSQKQRQRAQKAESELEKMKARNKKMEEDSMVEQNKFKELWEQDKNDAEWARGYKKKRKASLLESLPEDKREKFSKMKLSLDALETIVEELGSTKTAETMKAVPGQVSTSVPTKPWGDMTDAEKRAYYTQAAMQKGVTS